MNLPAIRMLVDEFDNHQLQQAEASLMDGVPPEIHIPGTDVGEQLTHVLAALWVVQHMKATSDDVTEAIRAYVQRVRSSIL